MRDSDQWHLIPSTADAGYLDALLLELGDFALVATPAKERTAEAPPPWGRAPRISGTEELGVVDEEAEAKVREQTA